MNALKKADYDLQRELKRQIDIIYPASVIVWWKEYGWRKLRIMRRLATSQQVWTECADYGIEKSMLQMLEEETGIEMTLSGIEGSWHTLAYMDGAAWDGRPLTLPQTIYMRQQQKKWIAPMLLACMCLSLYRDEKWGPERIGKFIGYVDDLRGV